MTQIINLIINLIILLNATICALITLLKWTLLLCSGVGALTVWVLKLPFRALRYLINYGKANPWFKRLVTYLFIIALMTIPMRFYKLWQDEITVRAYFEEKAETTEKVYREDVTKKEERIQELEKTFKEMMENPITFQQTYFLETQLLPLTRKHGIPDSLAAAQWAIESGRQVNKPGHNYFGLMKWDQNRVRSLQYCVSLDQCVTNYANTIKSILARKGYSYDPKEDPYRILEKLQEKTPRYEGDFEDTYHYVKLISGSNEYKRYSK